ncbi:hypothetical protein LO772_29825 [Yinghuangia sp. ASG 101]|uniref:hypothetical protein n=1 Tax=Yinghuangia sp. ASG 101 TaxID=2896848 RepID=UPI001E3D3447|nr:hypothetical protein [Yinghuangia sp. ASG 101]UGQ10966.1 hypothetical protein LO772_29825 [Yinghuangia sp. ASG 101]
MPKSTPAPHVIEAWLIALVTHNLISAAWKASDGGWLVQRRPGVALEPLPGAEEALEFITKIQRESRPTSEARIGA